MLSFNVVFSRDSNPLPIGCKPSPLTTRTRLQPVFLHLLVKKFIYFYFHLISCGLFTFTCKGSSSPFLKLKLLKKVDLPVGDVVQLDVQSRRTDDRRFVSGHRRMIRNAVTTGVMAARSGRKSRNV